MAVLWTLLMLTLCWIPGDLLQKFEGDSSFFQIPNLDKLIHWGIFAAFSVLWLRVGVSRWRYLWVTLAGIALAAISEIVQTVPFIGRDGEVGDLLTDLLGIGIGLGLAVAGWLEPFLRRVEATILPGSRD